MAIALTLFAAPAAQARTVESVAVTPQLQVTANAASAQGLPGATVPVSIGVSNPSASLGLGSELGYVGGLFTNSVVKSWYAVIEYQPVGGSWTPLAGVEGVATGYTPVQSAPLATGLTASATPVPRFGVTYPSGGDRIAGTQVAGFNFAQWDIAYDSTQIAQQIAALLSSAQTNQIRMRTRIEARRTGLFGIQYSDTATATAVFTQMLRSQSATATDVQLDLSTGGPTQSFDSTTDPGLGAIAPGASVALSGSVALPSVAARQSGESDGEYLARLRAATEQSVLASTSGNYVAGGIATPYLWWFGENDPGYELGPQRTIALPTASASAGVALPIMEIAKSGPETIDAGQTAVYDVTVDNTGDAVGLATATDTIDGQGPATLDGFGQLAPGQQGAGTHSYAIPTNFGSTQLHDQAAITWSDGINEYGPLTADFTSTVVLDTTPPAAPQITAAPPALTRSGDVTFVFTGEPSGTFRCAVDGAAEQDCLSPVVLADVADGAHVFSVRQVDDAGNVGSVTAYVWTVDTTPPAAPQLSGVPSSPTSSASATIGFTGEAGSSFACATDGAGWQLCSEPLVLSSLADGEHAVQVRQTDDVGNVGQAATAQWTVDTVAPAAPQLNSTPNPLTRDTTAGFGFAGEPDGSFSCSLDGEPFGPCVNPVSYESLAEGSHSFQVRQTDDAGNAGDLANFEWTIDHTPPDAPTITNSPPPVTTQPDASFEFTGEPGAQFECALDAGEFAPCTSPATFNALADGAHTFSVRQTDAAGNVGGVATHGWTVDTVAPPAPTIDSGPTGIVNSDVATFEFTGESGGSFECALDASAFTACTSLQLYADLAEGEHTFAVRQVDAAANTSLAATSTFTVQLSTTQAGIAGETLTVTSEPGSVNTVDVSFSGGVYTITDQTSKILPAPGCQGQDSHTVTCNELLARAIEPGTYASVGDTFLLAEEGGGGQSQVTQISVSTGDQGDQVTIDESVPVPATVNGGDGDDVLFGGPGQDVIDAGAGDDQVDSVDGEVDEVFCGEGTDSVRADRTDVLHDCENVSYPTTVSRVSPFAEFPTVQAIEYRAAASEANDVSVEVTGSTITFTDSSLEIVNGPGCDRVSPRSVSCDTTDVTVAYTFLKDGNDRFTADPASDLLQNGVYGGEGDDVLTGGPGVDGFDGGPGADTISGGGGWPDQVVYMYRDLDYSNQTPRDEGVHVSLDDQPDDGAPGEGDNVAGDIDWVIGSNHDDTLIASDNGTVLSGFAGNDELTGGTGDDRLHGNEGDDQLDGGGGADYMQGYEGADTVDYSSRSNQVTVNWLPDANADGEASEGDEVHGDVENVVGGAGDDLLRGTNVANVIEGGAGEDTVEALEGDDTIRVRDGESDTVRCGGTPEFPDSDAVTADSLPLDPTPDNDCETVQRPPSVTITDGPVDGGTIANAEPVFEFVSNIEGGSTECRVDAGDYTPCASPYAVSEQLSDGVHTVSIRAINPSTQIPGEPATRTFTVDATAPSLSVTSPSGVNESTALTVAFEATDGGGTVRTSCAIDFVTPTTCASGAVLVDLASGLHTLTVRATDPAGNVSEQIVEFVVDLSAPDVTVVPDSQVGGASDILVAAQPATASMIEVSRDGSTFTIVDNSSWLKADANCVQVDLHRVTCAPAYVAALTVDAGDGDDAVVVNGGLNVQTEVDGGAGDDSLVSFGSAMLRGDAGDDKIVGSSDADTVTGGAGRDTIRTLEGFDTIDVRDGEADDVRCGGDSGSVAADADDTIDVDCGSVARTPTVTFTAGPVDGDTTGDTTPTFGFVSDDAIATFQCSVDGASYSPCEDEYTTGELSDGPHTIAVAATGVNGTGATTTAFSVDTAGPFGVVTVVNGSDLSVALTSDVANEVNVRRAHGQYTVSNSTGGLGSGGGCVQRDHHTVVCDDNGIAAVGVTTGDLGDTVSLNTRVTATATITGGVGADALTGGSGVDIIVGGTGNDTVDGGAGGDNLDGGSGDDDIVSADGEQDSVACLDGADSALVDAFDTADACESVTRRSVVANWTSPGLPPISYFVYGAAPGERNELEVTANSRKALFQDGTSLIYAGSGCSQEDPHTVACDGRDGSGVAALLGDDDDRLEIHTAAAMAVVVRGDDGSDLIRSRNGFGSLSGGPGDDTLVGGIANDELFGDEGNDLVDGGGGDDSLDGGDGVDTVDYSARTTGLTLTLGGVSNDNGAANEHDQISSTVENVRGGAANDTITGSADANFIHGGGGSDVIDSAEGDDTIHARDGKADQLGCGAGVDSVATDTLDTSSDCETSDLSAITTITAGPTDGGYVVDSTPSFVFEADDALATFQCRIDAEPFAPCGSTFTAAELTEGTHSFSVQALTPSLAPEGEPAISTFTVDTQAPNIALIGGPTEGDTTGDSSPSIEFASTDATASFTCTIDRDEPVACSSPFTLQNLTEDEDHTVVVRATDPAGNASAPLVRSFAVSSQALVSITSGPADSAHLQEPVAVFEFESELSTMFQCAVDGGEFAACSSPYTLESPYGGTRTFAVRALNAFGAPGPAERVPLFFEQGLPVDDTTRPKTYLDSGPRDGAISQYVPTFDFSANEEAAFSCRVDDDDWQGCESPWAPAGLTIGWHRVEIGAQDAAGNFTDRIVSREFAYDPDYHPAAVDEVVDMLETEFPEVLAPLPDLTVGDQAIAPTLTTQPDDGGDFVSRDTVVESTIASDPDSGFSIDTSDGPLSFAPADLASTASAPAVVAGNATVVADAGPTAAFVTRPAPLGTDVAVLLENQAFATSVTWQLDLAPDQELVMLADGSVAVRLPAPDEEDATADDNEEDPTAPGTPSGPGRSSYEAQVARIDAAQAQTDDSTVAVITAPVATDSQGNLVSTSLAVDNDTGSVTLHVGQPGTAGDNVSVRTSVLSNLVASASKARQARHVYYGMGGGPSEMFTAPLDPKTSTPAFDNVMSRLRKFTGVRSGSKVRYFNGRIFRMLVPWDAALHNGQCQAEPGNANPSAPPNVESAVDGANPYTLGTRCYDLWLALRKVKNAADWSTNHGNANYDLYVSPDQVYIDPPWNGADCTGIGGPRVHSPCALADYETAFDALYLTLQSYAKSRPNQRRIRFWSGLNEPDITSRRRSYGRTPPAGYGPFAVGKGKLADQRIRDNAVDAARFWVTTQKKMTSSAAGDSACRRGCTVFAGEFAVAGEFADAFSRAILRRTTRSVRVARSGKKPLVPKRWSYHGYGDIGKPGRSRYGPYAAGKEAKRSDQGIGAFKNTVNMYELLRNSGLTSARIWMTEGGANLHDRRTTDAEGNVIIDKSRQSHVAGNDKDVYGESARNVGVPTAAHRFKALIDHRLDAYHEQRPETIRAIKRVNAGLIYQLQEGDGSGFDSSLYENGGQAACDWYQLQLQRDQGQLPQCIGVSSPRPRPFYCGILGRPAAECMGDNRETSSLRPAMVTAGSTNSFNGRDVFNPYKFRVDVVTALGSYELNPDTAYDIRIRYRACTVYSGPYTVLDEDGNHVTGGQPFNCEYVAACDPALCQDPELDEVFGLGSGGDTVLHIPAGGLLADVALAQRHKTLLLDNPREIHCGDGTAPWQYTITPEFEFTWDTGDAGPDDDEFTGRQNFAGATTRTDYPAVLICN